MSILSKGPRYERGGGDILTFKEDLGKKPKGVDGKPAKQKKTRKRRSKSQPNESVKRTWDESLCGEEGDQQPLEKIGLERLVI